MSIGSELVRKRSWSTLSSRTRRFLLVAAVVDTSLKAAALIDLARRPAEQIRGSKRRWATAITVVNSMGALPLAYFRFGRRPG